MRYQVVKYTRHWRIHWYSMIVNSKRMIFYSNSHIDHVDILFLLVPNPRRVHLHIPACVGNVVYGPKPKRNNQFRISAISNCSDLILLVSSCLPCFDPLIDHYTRNEYNRCAYHQPTDGIGIRTIDISTFGWGSKLYN